MSVIVSCFNCFLLLLSCQFQVELPTYKKKGEGGGGGSDRHTHAQTTHLFSIVYHCEPALQRAQSTSPSPPTRFVAFICLLPLRRIAVATIAFALLVFLFIFVRSRVLIVFLYTYICIYKIYVHCVCMYKILH